MSVKTIKKKIKIKIKKIKKKNVKLGNSRRSRVVTAKKCTKKRDARAKLLFC